MNIWKFSLKTVKRIVKKIYCIFKQKRRKHRLKNSSEFKRFLALKGGRRTILLDTPEHGNLGDQAIRLAEKKFLSDIGYDFIEFTQEEYLLCRKQIQAAIDKKDLILVHGGGFVGTLWKGEEEVFLDILTRFHANRIVVFPQTVYFEDTEVGNAEEDKLRNVLKKCEDVTIFARDRRSYEFLRRHMINVCTCMCVPDIVTYLNFHSQGNREKKILLCHRRDKEKVFDSRRLYPILEQLKDEMYEIIETDTVIEKKIDRNTGEKEVYSKLKEFSSARLILTDRLHGMLFAAITGSPCIAVDNVSKKVSGAYEWLKYLDYIKCVDAEEVDDKLVKTMLDMGQGNYVNGKLSGYYQLIREQIEK